jgi:CPA2 family monovalent cation:H+ antiporter-2
MENVELLVDLAIAMGAALAGGFLAHLLRQPVILGYLLAGIVIGPYTPGLVGDVERVQTMANLGVTLLMFALGVEFSLETLRRVGRVAIYGGALQMALTIGFGILLGLVLGYSFRSSVFLGGIVAISSSILILKMLLARGELESINGRVALAIGIVQDLSMIVLIIILPAWSGGFAPETLMDAGRAVLIGVGFLVLAYVLGIHLVPPILARVAGAGSRELFLLTIVAIAVGTAMLGEEVGISFALAAFVAGLIVSESEFSTQVIDEIIPLRDIFATLFFVSIGMLINPGFVFAHLSEVMVLVVAILVGKLLIIAFIVKLFGYRWSNALRVGLLMAQIGEFSFVLAGIGVERGVIEDSLYNLVLAGALVSLVVSPILVNNADALARALGRVLGRFGGLVPRSMQGRRLFAERPTPVEQTDSELIETIKRHVIVCGFGRVGQEIARALQRRGFACVVIDYNLGRVEEGRRQGYLCLQGDSTEPEMLDLAGLDRAKMLVITLPDLPSAAQAVRTARALNPKVTILARVHDARAIPHLKAAGADEVIQPEFEAGMEMVRQALRSYGVSSMETQALTGSRRTEHYRGVRDTPFTEL